MGGANVHQKPLRGFEQTLPFSEFSLYFGRTNSPFFPFFLKDHFPSTPLNCRIVPFTDSSRKMDPHGNYATLFNYRRDDHSANARQGMVCQAQ